MPDIKETVPDPGTWLRKYGERGVDEHGNEGIINPWAKMAKEVPTWQEKVEQESKGFTQQQIKELTDDYKVSGKRVFDKSGAEIDINSETALKARVASLVLQSAQDDYKTNKIQRGGKEPERSKSWYVQESMDRYCINGDNENHPISKVIKELIASKGHAEFTDKMFDITDRHKMFREPKMLDGVEAILRLRYREQGKDVSNLRVQIQEPSKERAMKGYIVDYDVK